MKRLYFLPMLLVGFSIHSIETATLPSNVTDDEVTGHSYVDLGLPSGTLWATTNIGAKTAYDSGQYYAWGETEPRQLFNWKNYAFLENESIGEDGSTIYTVADIGDDISGTQYDAARIQWGDAWRMPTKEECEELIAYCSAEFLNKYDTSGLLIIGQNNNSLFLPISLCPGNGITTAVMTGNYWSATASSDNSNRATSLYFANSTPDCINVVRCNGLSIRPVINRQDIGTSVATMTDDAPYMTFENGSITVKGYAHECRLAISDLSGRRVLDTSLTDGKCEISNLPDGIYLATLLNAGKALKTIKISIK